MKRGLQSLLFTVLLIGSGLLFGAVLTSQSGCSTSQQRTAVNTLRSTAEVTDAAFKAYLDGVLAGTIKTNDVPKVAAAYSTFQLAWNAALVAATMNQNAVPTPDVANAASQVKLHIQAAKQK